MEGDPAEASQIKGTAEGMGGGGEGGAAAVF